MDRCVKLMMFLLVFINVLIPRNQSFASDEYVFNFVDTYQIAKDEVKKEVISITNEELLLLSKLINSEARGEGYKGQLAVAAVVINRVKDPRFPDNVKDVIYQRNAFSVVSDGSINLSPTESAFKAAQQALYGEDPTNKAIFFWNPDIATCKWIRTLNPYLRIGNHVFAK